MGIFVGAGGEGLVGVPGVFGEVLFDGVEVFPVEFGASGLVSPVIAADVEGEAGAPVFQGLGGVVAGELIEQAGEGFLGEVFGVFSAGDVAADDAGDEGVEVVDEGAGGGFVTMVQPLADQGWGIGGHCRLRIWDFGMRIGRGCDRRKNSRRGTELRGGVWEARFGGAYWGMAAGSLRRSWEPLKRSRGSKSQPGLVLRTSKRWSSNSGRIRLLLGS